MPCPKPSPLACLLLNSFLVLLVFLVVDYVTYVILFPGPNPYTNELGSKILFSLILAIVFAHAYNKASRIWRPNTKEAFLFYTMPQGKECNVSLHKVLNGVVFSILMSLAVILCIEVSGLFLTFLLTDVLHAFHGGTSTTDTVDVISKFVIAGVVLEVGGKTNDDADM